MIKQYIATFFALMSSIAFGNSWTFEQLKNSDQKSTDLVQWQHFGPGMSGYIDKFWINNGDPNAMYDFLDMGNGHVTLNRGDFWRSYMDVDGKGGTPEGVTGIEFSWQNPDFGLMMAKSGIYKSTDRGRSWDFLLDIDKSNSQMHSVLTVDPNDDRVWFIGAGQHWMIKNTHWTKDGLHYSTDGNYSAGYIQKSVDSGKTWSKTQFPNGDEDFSKIVVNPLNSDEVYATCQYGIFKSVDAGTNWTKLSGNGLTTNPPRDLGFYFDRDKNEFSLYYLAVTGYPLSDGENGKKNITTTGGVFRSDDNGASWINVTGDLAIDFTQIRNYIYEESFARAISFWNDLPKEKSFFSKFNRPTKTFSQFTRIAVDPTNKERIYLSHNFKHDYAFPPASIWMTENGGTNWFAAAREGQYWINNENKEYWDSRAVQPRGANVEMAHVHREHYEHDNTQSGPRFVFCNQLGEAYTAFAQQVMRSTDNGKTWNQIDDFETEKGSGIWVGRGNSNLPGETFCLNTGTPGKYLWGCGEHGLWQNVPNEGDKVYPNAIAMKQLTGQSVKDNDPLSISTIAIHPHDNQKIYLIPFRQNQSGTLQHSKDGGKTWEQIAPVIPYQLPNSGIDFRSLLIDHENPEIMYFCLPLSEWERWSSRAVKNYPKEWEVNGVETKEFNHYGIHKSIDGGKTWSKIETVGLPEECSVYRMEMDPVDPKTIYAALNETHDLDKAIPGAKKRFAPGGLYKSTNGGANWSKIDLPTGIIAVNHVQIHPTTRDIYIATGSTDSGKNVGGGFVSRDNGASWEKLFDMPYLRHFHCSLADPNIIVANVEGASSVNNRNQGAYISIDAGKTWHMINNRHGQPDGIRKIEADPYDSNVIWMSLHGTGFFRADISALKTGIKKPFFWDWMFENGLDKHGDMNLDSDFDGFSNQQEFIAAGDPNKKEKIFNTSIESDSDGNKSIQFQTKPNRFYSIETTDDLTESWQNLRQNIKGTGEIENFITPPVESNKFYRIKVSLP